MALFILVVELAARAGLISSARLPTPFTIIAAMADQAMTADFWSDIWVTVRAAGLGLALGTVGGVLLGALMSSNRWLDAAVSPIVNAIRPLPGIAYAPLLGTALGRGIESRSAVVAIACLWPVLFNTYYGLSSVDPVARQTARSFGESRLGVLRRVSFPAASPFIFTGVRVSASLALLVAVATEIVLPDGRGIGGIIAGSVFAAQDLEVIYAATLFSGVLSLCVNGGLTYVDHRFFGWKHVSRA